MVRRLISKKKLNAIHAKTAFVTASVVGGIVLFLVGFLWIGLPNPPKRLESTGVTFSVPYAEELGLNWREVLIAALDDLKIRTFRIPAYWSRTEPQKNQFTWLELDYQMDEIGARGGKVVLGVGAKLPRWPECWIPDWASQHGKDAEREARLNYIRAVVERYRNHYALSSWQVENEALFQFGICPEPDRNLLKEEIALVRSLDISHPIATTDSGELSLWVSAGSLVDRLGISTYRVVRTFWGATWDYTFIPTYWYARRAALIRPWVKDVYVSEFQMEPWVDSSIQQTPIAEQTAFFSPERMERHFAFAERMGFKDVSFWGIEWWWWMKVKQGDDRFWEIARAFFTRHGPVSP